eukprot:GGOE01016724.1.p1 GENE.GGOE01016724.1~~GGOE01016724.1.p1  ORF type:complete len:453 (-),score=63.44 GGOE01016724.1:312-1670(-)
MIRLHHGQSMHADEFVRENYPWMFVLILAPFILHLLVARPLADSLRVKPPGDQFTVHHSIKAGVLHPTVTPLFQVRCHHLRQPVTGPILVHSQMGLQHAAAGGLLAPALPFMVGIFVALAIVAVPGQRRCTCAPKAYTMAMIGGGALDVSEKPEGEELREDAELPPVTHAPEDIGVSYDELLEEFIDCSEAQFPLLVSRHFRHLTPGFFGRLQERRMSTDSAEEKDMLLQVAIHIMNEMDAAETRVLELLNGQDQMIATLLNICKDEQGNVTEVLQSPTMEQLRVQVRKDVAVLMEEELIFEIFVGTLHHYIERAGESGHTAMQSSLETILQLFGQEVLRHLCNPIPWDQDTLPEAYLLWQEILVSDERCWRKLLKKHLLDPASKITAKSLVDLFENGGAVDQALRLRRGSALQLLVADFIHSVLRRVHDLTKETEQPWQADSAGTLHLEID